MLPGPGKIYFEWGFLEFVSRYRQQNDPLIYKGPFKIKIPAAPSNTTVLRSTMMTITNIKRDECFPTLSTGNTDGFYLYNYDIWTDIDFRNWKICHNNDHCMKKRDVVEVYFPEMVTDPEAIEVPVDSEIYFEFKAGCDYEIFSMDYTDITVN